MKAPDSNGSPVWPFPEEDARRGWVTFHRAWLEHPRANDPEWLAVLVFILGNATHRPHPTLLDGRTVTLAPGQLNTGRKRISVATGVNESKVRRVLEWMENDQLIGQQPGVKSSIITVLPWALLQTTGQQNGQDSAKHQPATNHIQQQDNRTTGPKKKLGAAAAAPAASGEGKIKPGKEPDPEVHEFMRGWTEAFEAQFERTYVPNWGRDCRAVKELRKTVKVPASEILDVATAAWSSKTFWCQKAITVLTFCSRWNEINSELNTRQVNGTPEKRDSLSDMIPADELTRDLPALMDVPADELHPRKNSASLGRPSWRPGDYIADQSLFFQIPGKVRPSEAKWSALSFDQRNELAARPVD